MVDLHFLLHPLGYCSGTRRQVLECHSYNFWSGIESAIPQIAILSVALAWFRKHNCHVRGCWRMQFRAHEAAGAGMVVCRRHHPEC